VIASSRFIYASVAAPNDRFSERPIPFHVATFCFSFQSKEKITLLINLQISV